MSKHYFFINSAKGTENALEKELIDMGATIEKVTHGGVSVSHSDPEFYMLINLKSRIGLRVLVPLIEFPAADKSELYKGARKIHWENYFNVDQTFRLNSHISSSFTTHSNYPSLVVKDAIADRFRKLFDKRPNVEKVNADLSIVVYLKRNVASIYLDSSGFSLHKRGYRTESVKAPLMETLAAAMIRLSGWDGRTPFYDLMCGSGTFGIEAALFANKDYPGAWDQEFGFLKWKNFNREKYTTYLDQIDNEYNENHVQIFMNDKDRSALEVAKNNAKRAGVEDQCAFMNKTILDFHPKSREGIIILNPPYGLRMDENEGIRQFYIKLDRHLKSSWSGFRVCIITPEEEHLREIIMKPTKIYSLYNGDLPCKFGIFDIH